MEGNVGRGGVGRNLLKVSPRLARGIDVIDSIRPNLRNLVEAAHTNAVSPRGIGQKTSDFSAIPLCAAHHRENLDSYHLLGENGFSHKHGVDLEEIVLRLQSRFWQQEMSVSREASSHANAEYVIPHWG
jgi:hypothetical protein